MKRQQRFTALRAALVALIALLALVGAAQAAPARQDAYPAQEQPTADPLLMPTAPLAYPPSSPALQATPAPIGSPLETAPAVDVASPTVTPVADGQGLLYLWLGFIATLLIFGASVAGAVMLFTRRVQP